MADKDTEAAVVDENNKVLGTRYFSTSRQGYRQIVNAKIIGRFSPFLMSAIGH
ncbi:hypothetical protein NX165_004424 [Salmonella enterica]|nr:hypothetical protein [Salmonella enterica]EJQ6228170.1 hypothetical protein [Salmonella enterica]EJQ6613079.1 hypothetical protein [Salmonella enterica]